LGVGLGGIEDSGIGVILGGMEEREAPHVDLEGLGAEDCRRIGLDGGKDPYIEDWPGAVLNGIEEPEAPHVDLEGTGVEDCRGIDLDGMEDSGIKDWVGAALGGIGAPGKAN
jgi:hypothetical protein